MSDISLFADIPYRHTPQRVLHLDIRVPKTKHPPPLVMYIPIGGMRVSSKTHPPLWILESGFALASIECRVSSEAIAPAQAHDCKAAVRWLRAHADEYGFDGQVIGAWGSSAGGLLAALLATSGDAPALDDPNDEYSSASCSVQAACGQCSAPHDLAYFARPEIQARFPKVNENLRLYLGGPVEERVELARLVSPSTYSSPACPPIFLIHGDADEVVPVEETSEFHQKLLAHGVDATLKILEGQGHSWDAALTRDDVAAFFERTLRREE